MSVPLERFGKDHWSTFAYLEVRVVDHHGIPDREHMRVDTSRHPFQANSASRLSGSGKYPTRVKDGLMENHDDWDCLEDLEAAGLLENVGTGVNPCVQLTPFGIKIASQLRVHKARKGNFADFVPDIEVP